MESQKAQDADDELAQFSDNDDEDEESTIQTNEENFGVQTNGKKGIEKDDV